MCTTNKCYHIFFERGQVCSFDLGDVNAILVLNTTHFGGLTAQG